jgi:hypothetical protein
MFERASICRPVKCEDVADFENRWSGLQPQLSMISQMGVSLRKKAERKQNSSNFVGRIRARIPNQMWSPSWDLYSFIEHTILHEVAMTVDKCHASC